MNENSPTNPLERVRTLTFDIFGTVLNLAGSLVPHREGRELPRASRRDRNPLNPRQLRWPVQCDGYEV